jgi:hypothetical protein
MLLKESMEMWKKYGLNLKKELRSLHISEIIVGIGDQKYGIKATLQDLKEGRCTTTNKPIDVIWLRDENKFLLEDGYHRIVEGLLQGKSKFLCSIDWKGYTLLWHIPELNERFDIKKHNLELL